MNASENDLRVDYIEFPAKDINKTKDFYSHVFNWKFEDYGPEYTCFRDGRLSGGFFASEDVRTGGALVIIYTSNLESMLNKVEGAGGEISKPIFEFPGGRRFHFIDPSGNELAVWTDK